MRIEDILNELCVPHEGYLFIHSSADWLARAGISNSLGVIESLQRWIGDSGTLIMPSFPYRGAHINYLKQNPVFDVVNTPSRVGWITELFRRMANVSRSLHPDHPLCAWGVEAKLISDSVVVQDDPFGEDSVWKLILGKSASLVGLGVSLNTNAFLHAVDAQLSVSYQVPIYHHAAFEATTLDYSRRLITYKLKAILPKYNVKAKPSAIIPLICNRHDMFSELHIEDVQFFRWNLKLWEAFCIEHAHERLAKGEMPLWLPEVGEK